MTRLRADPKIIEPVILNWILKIPAMPDMQMNVTKTGTNDISVSSMRPNSMSKIKNNSIEEKVYAFKISSSNLACFAK